MFNGMDWSKGKEKFRRMFFDLSEGQRLHKRFQKEHWSFLGAGDEENGMERTSLNLKENGIAPQM